jgi:nicotinate dehydrogenase subunit B
MGHTKTEMGAISNRASARWLDRRDFMKLAGSGIVILFTIDASQLLTGQEFPGMGYPSDPNAFLKIAADGRVTIYSSKIEMGQGVMTSLAQMAADELGVSLDSVDMIMGDTDLCAYDMGTFGSMSTRFFGPALRAAAAEAKAVLIELAAEQLKTPKERLSVENGVVFVTAEKNKRVSFGQLTQGQKITRQLSAKPATKDLSQFTLMGKSITRLDARAKATGKAKYAGDLRLPDMLYAKILRPPAHGATLKRVDTSAAEKVSGVTLVNKDGIIAVLHREPEEAEKALRSINAEYDKPEATFDSTTVFDHLLTAAPPPQERDQRGNLAEGEKMAAHLFETRYNDPYLAHAPIETHTALAQMEGEKMTVWASTQTPFPLRQQIAQALGVPQEKVRVITPFVGGGFGGKGSGQQAVEAALLARQTGKPVQVAWNRAEEFFFDTFRPAAVVKIKSGIDRAGKICLWDYDVYCAGARGLEHIYDVPNNLCKVRGEWFRDTSNAHPFGIGAWRGPGANTNAFARESQIDIMAAKAKIDPLEFRLNNISDQRMRKVLQAVADRFGYKKAAAPSGRGYGIACAIDAGSYVALMAEVKVDSNSGAVKVVRIVCAQEMGTVINPTGALMQVEGCIMMGLGYTLSEEISFKGGEIFTSNFDTYELPRFSWLPKIDGFLVQNDELPPQGGGEPAIVPVGAVVANAIFDAAGIRLFQLPLTAARVKAATPATSV